MTREEILSAIAKTDKVINNPTMPEAVKQVAIDTRAKYQAQLDAMGGEEPKVEKEEVVETEVEKEVEKEVVAPKKERVKFERKPRTPKAPAPKKEEETPESKAEKSMEGKKLTVANCRELLAKLKTRREGAKKRVATRKKQGKPAQLTTIEVLKKASDNLEKKVETEVNKDGKLQKTTITRSTKEVVDIVATIISGIPTKAERTEYINEVIADLKKLIDKVEPITEKMAKGGMMAKGGYIVKDRVQGSQGDYEILLTYNGKTQLSNLTINDIDNPKLSTTWENIPYSVVDSFAEKFKELIEEEEDSYYEDDFTENDWSYNNKIMSYNTGDTKFGAMKNSDGFTFYINDKTMSFESESLMQSISNAFIELIDEVGESGYDDDEDYAKGGLTKDSIKRTLVEDTNQYFLEKDGDGYILYITPNGATKSTFHEKFKVEDLGTDGGRMKYRLTKKGGYMADGGMLYKNWDMQNGEVTYKGKSVTPYYYDRDVDVFFLDIVKGGRGYAIGFKEKKDAYDYLNEHKNLWKYANGGMMAKGGKISRNKNKNDYNSMFEFFVENNYQPIGKRDLINMAYESSNGIDSAIPQSMAGDVDNTAYYVYDYQTDKMGELVDLREKLKFSNVKVDVTIVQDDELKYGDDLPSELQNATFHQALNYVFKNDDVEKFAIRPKK
jgi:hypothetical protein